MLKSVEISVKEINLTRQEQPVDLKDPSFGVLVWQVAALKQTSDLREEKKMVISHIGL